MCVIVCYVMLCSTDSIHYIHLVTPPRLPLLSPALTHLPLWSISLFLTCKRQYRRQRQQVPCSTYAHSRHQSSPNTVVATIDVHDHMDSALLVAMEGQALAVLKPPDVPPHVDSVLQTAARRESGGYPAVGPWRPWSH